MSDYIERCKRALANVLAQGEKYYSAELNTPEAIAFRVAICFELCLEGDIRRMDQMAEANG